MQPCADELSEWVCVSWGRGLEPYSRVAEAYGDVKWWGPEPHDELSFLHFGVMGSVAFDIVDVI